MPPSARPDATFTGPFDAVFTCAGMRVIYTRGRAPQANAYVERVIGTLGRECLDWLLTTGPRNLNAILTDYLDHYTSHRPHRGLDSATIAGRPPPRNWHLHTCNSPAAATASRHSSLAAMIYLCVGGVTITLPTQRRGQNAS